MYEGSSDKEPVRAPAARTVTYQGLLKMLKSIQAAEASSKSASPAARAPPRAGPARVSTSPAAEPEGLKLKMKKREESGLWQCAAADKARSQSQDPALNRLLKGIVENITQRNDVPAAPATPETVSYEKYERQRKKYAELLEDYKKLQLKYDCLEHESRWLLDKLERGDFAETPRAADAAPAQPAARADAPVPKPTNLKDTADKKHLGRGVYVSWAKWRALERATTQKMFVRVAAETLFGRQALIDNVGPNRRALDPTRLRVIQDLLHKLTSSGKFKNAPSKSSVVGVQRYIRCYMASLRLNRSLDVQKRKRKKSLNDYPCSVCGRRFTTLNSRHVHERIHSDQRPYRCSECPLSFIQQSHFNQHLKLYHPVSGLRECSLCERSYPQLAHLRWHLIRAHSNRDLFKEYKPTKPPPSFL